MEGLAIRYYSYSKNHKTQKNWTKNYSTKNYRTKRSYNATIEAILNGLNVIEQYINFQCVSIDMFFYSHISILTAKRSGFFQKGKLS